MSSGDPETRKRILEVTRQLMEKRRGKDVRLEDIAEAADVSRQAIYLHFGSRAGLLIATARYLDDTLGLSERLVPVQSAESGIQHLEALVEFWTNYIPDIYGLAKALMTVRETDEAAAAAWNDRMEAVYIKCLTMVQHLASDGLLSPAWTIDEAADFMWATLSIAVWEQLTIERGWTQEQYMERIQMALKRTLVKVT
jgi:AcrR family transcriptional regulator